MEIGISKKNYIAISIIVVNIIYFIFLETHGGSTSTMVMLKYGASFPVNIQGGEYYRLVTSMFMHFGIEHIANNMLILAILGCKLEDIAGHIRFFIIYMLSGVLANIASDWFQTNSGDYAVCRSFRSNFRSGRSIALCIDNKQRQNKGSESLSDSRLTCAYVICGI